MSDDKSEPQSELVVEQPATDSVSEKSQAGFPWLGVFNLCLILSLASVAAYYWQLQQKTGTEKQAAFEDLRQQMVTKVEAGQLQSGLLPLKSGLAEMTGRIEQLQQHQQDLQASGEKLYELFGRDENGWQFAEVEYLMRIAQHKLILENDFAGAAMTLQAASDRIAATGDIGLLPVRLKISDEIAELKVNPGTDLVGMTLKLSQLGQQIRGLKPGFQPVIRETIDKETTNTIDKIDTIINHQSLADESAGLFEQVQSYLSAWLNSLVRVKYDAEPAFESTSDHATFMVNVGEKLQDNLKLARWSVLERDTFQYQRLMAENVELFTQFYNLEDAANHDFYTQLQALQKDRIKPEKPDITGSLVMLKKIISKRGDAEQENADNA